MVLLSPSRCTNGRNFKILCHSEVITFIRLSENLTYDVKVEVTEIHTPLRLSR